MRGPTRAKWTVCAVVVALAATGCGRSTGAGASQGVVRASWGDPQNPLEPANTNEVQGGKVLDMVFRGLKKYNPRTGAAEDWIADSITTDDQHDFTVKLKSGWKFSNGEPVDAHSFVDAWNYGALVTNKQVNASFFSYIEGYAKVHPNSGDPTAKTMSGLQVKDANTFTVKLGQKFSTWPGTLGYSAFYPLPKTFFSDHDGWLKKPVGNGPYAIDTYAKGSMMRLRKWDGYNGPDKAKNGGVDLQVYTDSETAYTDLQAGNIDLVDDIPANQLKNVSARSGFALHQPAGRHQPDHRLSALRPEMEREERRETPAGHLDGHRPEVDHQADLPRHPHPRHRLDLPGARRRGRLQGRTVRQALRVRRGGGEAAIKEGGGLPGGQMKIVYNADTGSHKEWVDAICNSVNNSLGDDQACVGAPVGTFADFRTQVAAKHQTQPFRAGWQMDYPLIQDFLQPQYYTGASSNDAGFHNAQFDKLVDKANAESDTAKAVADFQDAERILAQQMPSIPLWYQNGNAGYSQQHQRCLPQPVQRPGLRRDHRQLIHPPPGQLRPVGRSRGTLCDPASAADDPGLPRQHVSDLRHGVRARRPGGRPVRRPRAGPGDRRADPQGPVSRPSAVAAVPALHGAASSRVTSAPPSTGSRSPTLMATAFPVTVRLTLVAVVFEVGHRARARRWSPGCAGAARSTPGCWLLTLIVVSVPTFVTGYVLQYAFGVQLGHRGSPRSPRTRR